MSHLLLRCLVFVALLPFTALAASPKLEISGGNDSLQNNIRAYLAVPERNCELSPWHKGSFSQEITEKVTDAGRALGYYHLQFESHIVEKDGCWTVTVTLQPGNPVVYASVVAHLEGDGAENPVLQKTIASNPMIVGATFNHSEYESYKSRLLHTASSQGFFDARFIRSQVLVSREDNSARVTLILNTGSRYRIGKITINHDILNRSLIDRYVQLQSGQAYRSEDLVSLKSEFQSSGYFESVTVEPRLGELSGGEVPVSIDLLAGSKHHYVIGAGYSSDTGARIRLGYENRYINSAGHNLDATVNASEVITTYQLGYSIPMARPAYQVLRLYTGFSQEDINDSISNRLVTGLNYSSWESSQWLNNYGLSYEEEEFSFGEDPSTHSEFVIPMFSTSYTMADGVKYPRRGWSAFVRVKGASDSVVSSTDFAQVFGRLKLIFPAGEGRIMVRFEGGITEVDDFSKLPISQRFFAGGDASVRGYDYKTLGPVNDDDIVVGGSRLVTSSIEYDRKVYGDFVLAAFYDEGTAFNKGYLDPYRGIGVGLRWLSPVGPVRADVAKALDGHEGWRLHLSVGPDL
ncbi:autotransporter assembly complex family protein [Gilvimarinus sp. SDUM040013]|uniref:Translocation and assembly module subunit TamA n=1 Tax=Gilvimarinus gilvus TaxID=3058038 RepID=A0ABU4RV87_9GAMM|nr:autotransporter assembly complex family protein [Gilvimarinus sp. SDUM040013]MDO3387862.1 autotransporter assembly complex family protein [Gilvimarinus sp. SDUM040013]MDX6848767.1 autotransporter assembly complex family protein [Gilvimarinus sp. SDUM040013]